MDYFKRRALYESRISKGLCVRCLELNDRADKKLCSKCKIIRNKETSDRVDRYKIENRCIRCGVKKQENILESNIFVCVNCWFSDLSKYNTKTRKNLNLIRDLMYKQNWKCAYTGVNLIPGKNASLDHKIPRSRGGSDNIDNLEWVCLSINYAKGRLTKEEFLGLILSVKCDINNDYISLFNEIDNKIYGLQDPSNRKSFK